jgi:hypothetical protein
VCQQLKVEQRLVKNNRVCFPGLPQLYRMQITWQQRITWKTQPSAQDSCPGTHKQTGSITQFMTHHSISNHKHQTQTIKGDGEFSTPIDWLIDLRMGLRPYGPDAPRP